MSNAPPSPLPAVGTYYAVVQPQESTVDVLTNSASIRILPVLIGLYGAPPTVAGRQQLDILLAWLHKRAREVDRHPGLRVIECLSADDQRPVLDLDTRTTHYAYIRYLIRYQQGV